MLKEGKSGSPQFAELKRADYIEVFFKNIQWKAAEERLR
jgi:superoxide dismutase